MNGRNILIWGLVIVFFVVALQLFEFKTPGPQPTELSFSQFVSRIEAGNVANAKVAKGEVTGKLADGTDYVTTIADDGQGARNEKSYRLAGVDPAMKPTISGRRIKSCIAIHEPNENPATQLNGALGFICCI